MTTELINVHYESRLAQGTALKNGLDRLATSFLFKVDKDLYVHQSVVTETYNF